VNIRKFVLAINSMDDLVAVGTLTEQAVRFLEASVVAGRTSWWPGALRSGKTTLSTRCAVPTRLASGHHRRGGVRASARVSAAVVSGRARTVQAPGLGSR
jgi:hypothetical protein